MKTIPTLLLVLLPALAHAGAPAFEIRFHPSKQVYSYPLDEAARTRSVQLQNAVVINRTGEAVVLASLEIELVAEGNVVESRRFEEAELDRVAKAGHMLQSSGIMDALRFQFGGEALVPAGVQLARGTVLPPGQGILLARQFFAMRGQQTQLRVRARGLADGRVIETTASLPIANTESRNTYRFPLKGAWYVGAGATLHSHHRTVVAQEFALELVQVDGTGATFAGTGTRREEFRAYGAPVVAVAAGKVVAAVSAEPENDEDLRRPGEAKDEYMLRVRKTQMSRLGSGANGVIGNHVVIAHEGGEHSVYAHLKPGSVRVKVGELVKAGDAVGLVGTSGNSTEPHLHFQVCDAPEPLTCAGIPIRFEGIELPNADSARALQTGDFVLSR